MIGTELHRRSIVKAVTWRLMGTFGTCLVAWWVTGSLRTGLGISLVDSAIKVLGFYVHERAWHRVSWGIAEPGPADGQGGGI
jgi:uncharacterized membrane protein